MNITQDNTAETAASIEAVRKIDAQPKPHHSGFGGWMYLFAIAQIYLLYGCISASIHSIAAIQLVRWVASVNQTPSVTTLVYTELIGRIALIVLTAGIAYMTITRSKYYVRSQMLYIVTFLLFSLVVGKLQNDVNYQARMIIYPDPFILVPVALTACAIWMGYFLNSKRIANTFNR